MMTFHLWFEGNIIETFTGDPEKDYHTFFIDNCLYYKVKQWQDFSPYFGEKKPCICIVISKTKPTQ